MSKVHGKDNYILINGVDVSNYLNKIDENITQKNADVTGFRQPWETSIAGQLSGDISADGFYADGDESFINDALELDYNDTSIVWYRTLPTYGTLGRAGKILTSASNITTTYDDAVKTSFAASLQRRDLVKCIAPTANYSGDIYTTVVDLGALVVNKIGRIYIQILNVEDMLGGDLVVKLQTSTNNVDWTDVTTDITYDSVGSAIVDVTGVNRYVRVSLTVGDGVDDEATLNISLFV